ncbi:ERF family protein [Micromonospora robiginosa]|uniref:ERF family protein n=1 Tax=Micromonospora robiginosa TaxID=2749844 RepID=A0A7L6B8U3_9ACTN|nr:ERF family protein [Micromonospora ferruginea]QLQ37960.1 ERF family protein [Micromonospora ferruginea]
MSKLRERVDEAEGVPAGDGWPELAEPGSGLPAARPPAAAEPVDELPDIEYTGAIADVDQVPVHTAWARVMADVQSIGKGDRFSAGGGGNYQYRGVDRVLNAVGPALRRHGVMVIPVRTEANYRDVLTAASKKMRECTVTVTYSIRGPRGDEMPAQSCGESMDTGDKGTTKACTVAYRNLLITALSIPTRDPRLDAEASNHERGSAPAPRPADYRDEISDPRTSLGRLKQVAGELQQHNLLAAVVTNEVGEQEPLGAMYSRVVRQRRAEAGQ